MKKNIYERPFIRKIETVLPNKIGEYVKSTCPTIDDLSVENLMECYGSPLFVFSEKKIRANIKDAKRAFTTRYPNVVFAWSYKTNYLNEICKTFHDEGSWAEVVSGFEYEKALKNGVAPSKIIFNGPYKKEDELELAIKNNSFINIDNKEELLLIEKIAMRLSKQVKVGVRVNLDSGLSTQWDKFGFNLENGSAFNIIQQIIFSKNLIFRGLHCHIGTFIQSSNPYRVAVEKIVGLALEVEKKFNVNVEYIDMGGGFASSNTLKNTYFPGDDLMPSFDDYADAIIMPLLVAKFSSSRPMLILETGRALIDNAGFLLSKVIANKRNAQAKRMIIIDAGVNLLFTSFWYNHKVLPAQCYSKNYENVILCGPLCMNIDVVRTDVALPMMNCGDIVVIHNVGAYNVSQWLQFITYRPNVVFITDNKKVEIIRKAENLSVFDSQEENNI